MSKTVEFEAEFTYSPEYQFSAELEVKPPESRKPPGPPRPRRFIDLNLDAATWLLKGLGWLVASLGSIDSALGWWPNISDALRPFFGRRLQPAQA